MTYGRGRMWTCLPLDRVNITALDVVRWPWEVEPDTFMPLPAWRWPRVPSPDGFDVVAVDPPWAMGKRGREAYGRVEFQHLVGSVNAILNAAVEAARYYNALLLVHWRQQWVPRGWRVAGERWTRTNIYGNYATSWWGLLARKNTEVEGVGGLQAVQVV